MTKKTSTITSPTAIKDLFSQETLEKAAREFEGYTKRTEDEAGIGSLMVILGFFILLYLRRIKLFNREPRGTWFIERLLKLISPIA